MAGRITRRNALSMMAAAGLTGAVAGCTGSSPQARPTGSASGGVATGARLTTGPLLWATWPDYIDVDDSDPSRRPTLDAFTRRTGIQVVYREVIDDNQAFVDTVNPALSQHRPIGFDVIVLTGWMAAQLAQNGDLQPLDLAVMPNAGRVLPALSRLDWDPDGRLARPWQAGLTGIAYDASKVERPVQSISELLHRSDLKGKVALLSEYDDSVGMAMLARGYDPSDIVQSQAETAIQDIAAARHDGQVALIAGNEYIDKLVAGEIVASLAWSGDIIQAQADNPYIKFVVPEEGIMIWADMMLVPDGSSRVADASRLIDYYYQPTVAAQLADWVNYICPVQGAQAAMEKIDPALAESPLIFPDDAILNQSFAFATLPPALDNRLRGLFHQATA